MPKQGDEEEEEKSDINIEIKTERKSSFDWEQQ
jgi:hypothetical protein